jgi:hypothetical protein
VLCRVHGPQSAWNAPNQTETQKNARITGRSWDQLGRADALLLSLLIILAGRLALSAASVFLVLRSLAALLVLLLVLLTVLIRLLLAGVVVGLIVTLGAALVLMVAHWISPSLCLHRRLPGTSTLEQDDGQIESVKQHQVSLLSY